MAKTKKKTIELQTGTAQEICDIIFKDKSLAEVKKLAVSLLDHCLSHGWADEELTASIVCNICREHNLVPPKDLDYENEWWDEDDEEDDDTDDA